MRVYPGTPLGGLLAQKSPSQAEAIEDFLEPAFYFSPALGNDPVGLVRECLDGDPRFLLLAKPGEQGSYNYVDDRWLSHAIENGARGAYWDIIRKNRLASRGN